MKHKPNFVHIGDSMMAIIILLQILLLLLSEKVESAGNISLPGCQDSCGGIPIPYPFGIGTNCSLSEDFNVTCDASNNGKPTPLLYGGFLEIVNISVPSGQARFNLPISSQCYNTTTKKDDYTTWGIEFSDSGPFWLNNEKNKLIVTGCNTLAYLTLDASIEYSVGCLSTCDSVDSLKMYGASCYGIGCCQTALPRDTKTFFADFDERYNQSLVYNFSPCSFAMVVDADHHGFGFDITSITPYDLVGQTMPAVFDWAIGNTTCKDAETNKSAYACKSDHSVCLNSSVTGQGYICNCSEGYQGNPYLQGGCQDIDECAIQNPCSQRGKCHNVLGGYRCSCHFGWRSTLNDIQNSCELNLALVIGSSISLTTRLRIAIESAEALAYLHTSASPPIFHGDVKSANILLDQNYAAKVSDFGASILAPTDEAQLVTFVQGTLGYLDPEYMQTSQLTDKSDVYSFGVVLLELLTSKSVINYDAPEEERSLSSHFLSAMRENKMQELLDDEIKHEDDMELIREVAELARDCLNIKGEERPMMKQVAEELHRISKLKQQPWEQEYSPEESRTLLSDGYRHDTEFMYTGYHFNVDKEAEESIALGR